ncbi:hypothetical protein CFOL_v3_17892 [Cephalotus follicularis]|uniref:Uncharacterized protein n=1 Tax=Cephalotus follicularis TaxID=3775 RepID=A0A1Q3C2Q4_CEPFO|nr:hypothetical protein CFOL_v3_17892 [Cephalotus follicularis]
MKKKKRLETAQLHAMNSDLAKPMMDSQQQAPVLESEIEAFHKQIHNGRFNDETLGILETVLVSKDVKSSIEVRSNLRELLRSESLSVIRQISQKTVELKLSILEFFVRAFALIGDIERCLALRYEALLLRELKSTTYQWLQVSYLEWLTFAEQSTDNGFNAIAGQACDNALLCLQRNNRANLKADKGFDDTPVRERIKRLKDYVVTSAASRSAVQAQTAGYLKKKLIQKTKSHSPLCKESVASTMFRNGIKKRNVRKLHEHQACSRFLMDQTSIQI